MTYPISLKRPILFACIWMECMLQAQNPMLKFEILADSSQSTKSYFLSTHPKAFQSWLKKTHREAQEGKFRFSEPQIADFSDSFRMSIRVNQNSDTSEVQIGFQKKGTSVPHSVTPLFSRVNPMKLEREPLDMATIEESIEILAEALEEIQSNLESKDEFLIEPSNDLIPGSGKSAKDSITERVPDNVRKPSGKPIMKIQDPIIDINIQDEDGFEDEFEDEDEVVQSNFSGSTKIKYPLIDGLFRFNIGFLQLNNLADIRLTVMRYDEMPTLDNSKSLNIGFEKLWGLNLYRDRIRLWYGISYEFYNYRFQSNEIRIDQNTPVFNYRFADPSDPNEKNSEKSKLVSEYIGIPLAIGFQNSSKNRYSHNSTIRWMLGVHGGYLMNSYTKVQYYDDRKIKQYDDFNLNNLFLQAFTNFQWNHWSVYAKYSLTPIFQKNAGATQNNMAAGISVNF